MGHLDSISCERAQVFGGRNNEGWRWDRIMEMRARKRARTCGWWWMI